jgi:hypothetical protein
MNRRGRLYRNCLISILSASFLFGCFTTPNLAQVQPTFAPGLANTIAVRTMLANPNLIKLVYTQTPTLTWTASPTIEPSPTRAVTHTPTLADSVDTSTPTLTTAPSETPLPSSTPAPTSTPACKNSAEFVRDITIPDGARVQPGQYFTKIWLLRNNGTCTWNEFYAMKNFSGESMGVKAPQLLQRTVDPGETAQIAIDLVAPNQEGTHLGYWILQDDQGIAFESIRQEYLFFWVMIDVRKRSLLDNLGLGDSDEGGCKFG